MNKDLYILASGGVYLPENLACNQLHPVRQMYLQTMFSLYASQTKKKTLKVLEIGSYAGSSTMIIAKSILNFFGKGEIVCVDSWKAYRAKNLPEDDPKEHAKQVLVDTALDSGIIFEIFRYNIEVSGYKNMVIPIVGDSRDVLPLFKENSFDIAFVDGNHLYSVVKKDIQQAKRLVKKDGLICGDDLEMTWDIANKTGFSSDIEWKMDPIHKVPFHPGVSRAVYEELEITGHYAGFWCTQNEKTYNLSDGKLYKPIFVAGKEDMMERYFQHKYNIGWEEAFGKGNEKSNTTGTATGN